MSILPNLVRVTSKTSVVLNSSRLLCSKAGEVLQDDKTKGGFARAFDKYTAPQVENKPVDNQTFASLLRNSKLIDVGILVIFFN